MTYSKGDTAYLNNQILTASPKKLIEILYQAGIKHLKIASYQLEQNNMEEVNNQLIKVQDIVLELKVSVRPTDDSDIDTQLNELYDFMFNQLIKANLDKDKERIELVQSMLVELLETWKSL